MGLNTDKRLLVLGGAANAVSVVRSLGGKGISVHVSAHAKSLASRSRFAASPSYLTPATNNESYWHQLLIENREPLLDGAVILALDDAAISFISDNEEDLRRFYLLEQNEPQLRNRLLDKQETLGIASEAGLDVPRSWRLDGDTNVGEVASTMKFPLLVKPIYSHLFREKFGVKVVLVDSVEQSLDVVTRAREFGLDVMLCEWIPGPDSQLCSYYAYYDRDSRRVTEFTKFVTRRYPLYFGGGVFHGTSWQPDVVEAGRRFFDRIGMRGICNIEFKRDPRDSRLKVIESNPRVTDAQELLVRSGLDLAELAYRDATEQSITIIDGAKFKYGLTYWYPQQDFSAFVALRRKGKLSIFAWLRSVMRRHVLPYFRIDDPYPSLILLWRKITGKLSRLIRRGAN